MMFLMLLSACGKDPNVVVQGLQSENPVVREDMVLVARGVKEKVVRDALIGALGDNSDRVRERAVESLAAHGHKDAVPALIAMLGDTNSAVRMAAVDALGVLKDSRAVPSLIAYIKAPPPGEFPLNAVWALGNIGDHQAIPVLSSLRQNENPYVVYNAEVALRRLPAVKPKKKKE